MKKILLGLMSMAVVLISSTLGYSKYCNSGDIQGFIQWKQKVGATDDYIRYVINKWCSYDYLSFIDYPTTFRGWGPLLAEQFFYRKYLKIQSIQSKHNKILGELIDNTINSIKYKDNNYLSKAINNVNKINRMVNSYKIVDFTLQNKYGQNYIVKLGSWYVQGVRVKLFQVYSNDYKLRVGNKEREIHKPLVSIPISQAYDSHLEVIMGNLPVVHLRFICIDHTYSKYRFNCEDIILFPINK